MQSYFGKIVRVVKPINGFSLWNEDGTSFGSSKDNFYWFLTSIRLGGIWYAVGGGGRYNLIAKNGNSLGVDGYGSAGWHSLSVRQVKVEPRTCLERLLIFLGIQQQETEPALFGRLGAVEDRIPEDLLKQALSTDRKEDVAIFGPFCSGGTNVESYIPCSPRMHSGRRAPSGAYR